MILSINQLQIITTIVFLITMSMLGILYFKINKTIKIEEKKSALVANSVSKPLNFNQDIQFLDFLIKNKFEQKQTLLKLQKFDWLNNPTAEKMAMEIGLSIFNSMSGNYKSTILNYFSENGLKEY
ncbi:hypothetical protein V6O07_02220, partial [Arthrospira platensis SPKY2]